MDILETTLGELFPLSAGFNTMQLVLEDDDPSYQLEEDGSVSIGLRVILWEGEENGTRGSIRDIYEQGKIPLFDVDHLGNWERVACYLRALASVVSEALARQKEHCTVPADLVFFRAHPLNLKTAETEADFVKALRVKSRLGKLLN